MRVFISRSGLKHSIWYAAGRILILIAFLTGLGYAGMSQTKPIAKGTVTDSSGQGIAGVNVVLKGSTTGTTTNASGAYTLTLPVGTTTGTLVFSFVGFATSEQPLSSAGNVDVQLVSTANALADVVVVGYGTQRRANLTGAVNTVTSRNIECFIRANDC